MRRFLSRLVSDFGSTNVARSARRAPRRASLQVEGLEDRLVPATLVVNTHADLVNSNPGVLSLREAIGRANQSATPDTIVLGSGTYTLSLGQLVISNPMTIEGQGAGVTTVDGATLYRIFQVNGRPIVVLPGVASSRLPASGQAIATVSVTFADMSLRHGNGTVGGISGEVGGGAIQASLANLSIVGCQVSDNTGLNGGAINDSNGNVTLTGSTVSRNVSQSSGGGIAMFGGTLALNNSVVRVNSTLGAGGGVWTTGTVTLSGSTVSDNTGSAGGGIDALKAILTNSTVSDNSAGDGGGIAASTVVLSGCTVNDNRASQAGGGIYAGTATLTACTLSDNTADLDGGGCSVDTATFVKTTVSGNRASQDGGGLSDNTATLSGCIISHNSAGQNGGGIYLYALGEAVGPATLTACTLSDNSAQNGGGLWGALGGNGGIDGGKMQLSTALFYACTISGNRASQDGGGIDSYVAYLTDSTVRGNSASQSGGGIYAVSGSLLFDTIAENTASAGGGVKLVGGMEIQDTIVALNLVSFGGRGPDVYGDFDDLGHNLIGVYDPTVAFTFFSYLDLLGTPAFPLLPGLTELGNHGGPTETYALLAGSKALGNGVNVSVTTLSAGASAQATTLAFTNTTTIGGATPFLPTPFVPGMLLRLGSEVVLVTAVNANNTLTVQRGVDGTTASAHASGTSLVLAADQRGVLRPANGKVDIGAFD